MTAADTKTARNVKLNQRDLDMASSFPAGAVLNEDGEQPEICLPGGSFLKKRRSWACCPQLLFSCLFLSPVESGLAGLLEGIHRYSVRTAAVAYAGHAEVGKLH